MLKADDAANQTKAKLAEMTAELEKRLTDCIGAAISQGSCKATYFARNKFDSDNAVKLLESHGYQAMFVAAKDQRDNDQVQIIWG